MLLDDLPAEILKIICDHLEMVDIANIATLNKQFNNDVNPRCHTSEMDIMRRKRCMKLRRINILFGQLRDIFAQGKMIKKLISCPYITYEIIMGFQNIQWYWPNLSSNPNISMAHFRQIQRAHAESINNFTMRVHPIQYVLNRFSVITIDDLHGANYPIDIVQSLGAITFTQWKKYCPRTFDVSFETITKCGNITEHDVIEHPQYEWSYDSLLENPNISASFLWKRRRINTIITQQEIIRYCKDPVARYKFEGLFVHKYMEGHPEIQTHMKLASELFSIDIITHYGNMAWDYQVIVSRADIPLTYKLSGYSKLSPHSHRIATKPTCTFFNELIKLELQYERGEVTCKSMNDEKYWNIKRVVESQIYDWRMMRELMKTIPGDYYRTDAPPYVWTAEMPIITLFDSMTVNDI